MYRVYRPRSSEEGRACSLACETHDNRRHHTIIIITLLFNDDHYYGYRESEINFWGAKRPWTLLTTHLIVREPLPVQTMEACREIGSNLLNKAFTTVLDGGEWTTSGPGHFTLVIKIPVPNA